MEEALSEMMHGCALARNLELNLPNLSNQPSSLSNSCEEIIRVFKSARDRLNNPLFLPESVIEQRQNEQDVAAVQAWLRSSSYAQAVENKKKNPFTKAGTSAAGTVKTLEMESEAAPQFQISEGAGTSSRRSPVVGQRTRKRKDGQEEQRTVRAAAPRMGNTEIPPDDGFTWRKYGQKEILGSMYPRSYYRCTHKTFYNCDAKKQVQRLDEDPNTFDITYYGHHTCHISQTAPAPSAAAAAAPLSASGTIGHLQEQRLETHAPPTSIPLFRWLSMDMEGIGREPTLLTELNLQMSTHFNQLNSTDAAAAAAAGPAEFPVVDLTAAAAAAAAGPAEFPVVDLADAMFNSGGSSNSMDSIFPSSMQDN